MWTSQEEHTLRHQNDETNWCIINTIQPAASCVLLRLLDLLQMTPGETTSLLWFCWLDMGVSKNRGTPKSSILIGFSIINHPFWGYPYFWKHPYNVLGMSRWRMFGAGFHQGQLFDQVWQSRVMVASLTNDLAIQTCSSHISRAIRSCDSWM